MRRKMASYFLLIIYRSKNSMQEGYFLFSFLFLRKTDFADVKNMWSFAWRFHTVIITPLDINICLLSTFANCPDIAFPLKCFS